MKRKYEVGGDHPDSWFDNKLGGFSSRTDGFSSKRRAVRFAHYVGLAFNCNVSIVTNDFELELELLNHFEKPYIHHVVKRKLHYFGNDYKVMSYREYKRSKL